MSSATRRMQVSALLEGPSLRAQEAMEQATLAALAIPLLDALMEFDAIGMRLREGFYHTTKIPVKLSSHCAKRSRRAALCTGPLNSGPCALW